ncbi:MAG: hypothetical protein RL189_23 [Pseudomonadota bacterium]|jgi:hypothetical protein
MLFKKTIRSVLFTAAPLTAALFSACSPGEPVAQLKPKKISLEKSSDSIGSTTTEKNTAPAAEGSAPTPPPETKVDSASGDGPTDAPPATGSGDAPKPATGPGELKVSAIRFPDSMKSLQKIEVSFDVTNTGAALQGLYGKIRLRGRVILADIDRTESIESLESIPSGTTTKVLKFDVPNIPARANLNTCVQAFKDKAKTQPASAEFCKNVQVN